MAIFVIVHGGHAGGWQWRDVASILEAAGHTAYRPTLTGLGERVHLASPAVNVTLHVQDVVNVLVYEDLSDVILVGHSYGGMVVTGVAERVPDRLRHVVYLDAFLPEDGESARDIIGRVLGPSAPSALDEDVRKTGDGWRLLRPAADSDGTPNPRATDQPYSTFRQPIEVRNPAAVPIPRTYIQCIERTPGWPFGPVLAYCADRARARGARYYELPTGHAVWRTAPRTLADVLLSLKE
jgi:pimeloyl-ACP methyl ester carboxylesterase